MIHLLNVVAGPSGPRYLIWCSKIEAVSLSSKDGYTLTVAEVQCAECLDAALAVAEQARTAFTVHLAKIDGHRKHIGWIPEQKTPFKVGDVITWTQNFVDGPMFRLITAVNRYVPDADDDDSDGDVGSPRVSYVWEYLDRGISHDQQYRDDDDYDSRNSSDPQLTCWRRVLSGAKRG